MPTLLVQMRHFLVKEDALNQEGIFRLAGDTSEMRQKKAEMNKTCTFDGNGVDVNTVANLLKVFSHSFRVAL